MERELEGVTWMNERREVEEESKMEREMSLMVTLLDVIHIHYTRCCAVQTDHI